MTESFPTCSEPLTLKVLHISFVGKSESGIVWQMHLIQNFKSMLHLDPDLAVNTLLAKSVCDYMLI